MSDFLPVLSGAKALRGWWDYGEFYCMFMFFHDMCSSVGTLDVARAFIVRPPYACIPWCPRPVSYTNTFPFPFFFFTFLTLVSDLFLPPCWLSARPTRGSRRKIVESLKPALTALGVRDDKTWTFCFLSFSSSLRVFWLFCCPRVPPCPIDQFVKAFWKFSSNRSPFFWGN